MSFAKKIFFIVCALTVCSSTLLAMRARKMREKKLREHVTQSIDLMQKETDPQRRLVLFKQAQKEFDDIVTEGRVKLTPRAITTERERLSAGFKKTGMLRKRAAQDHLTGEFNTYITDAQAAADFHQLVLQAEKASTKLQRSYGIELTNQELNEIFVKQVIPPFLEKVAQLQAKIENSLTLQEKNLLESIQNAANLEDVQAAQMWQDNIIDEMKKEQSAWRQIGILLNLPGIIKAADDFTAKITTAQKNISEGFNKKLATFTKEEQEKIIQEKINGQLLQLGQINAEIAATEIKKTPGFLATLPAVYQKLEDLKLLAAQTNQQAQKENERLPEPAKTTNQTKITTAFNKTQVERQKKNQEIKLFLEGEFKKYKVTLQGIPLRTEASVIKRVDLHKKITNNVTKIALPYYKLVAPEKYTDISNKMKILLDQSLQALKKETKQKELILQATELEAEFSKVTDKKGLEELERRGLLLGNQMTLLDMGDEARDWLKIVNFEKRFAQIRLAIQKNNLMVFISTAEMEESGQLPSFAKQTRKFLRDKIDIKNPQRKAAKEKDIKFLEPIVANFLIKKIDFIIKTIRNQKRQKEKEYKKAIENEKKVAEETFKQAGNIIPKNKVIDLRTQLEQAMKEK